MDEVPFAELGNVSHTENSVIYLMCVCVCVCIYIYINYIIINFSASLNKYFLKCSLIFFFLEIYFLFVYFWLCWVFVAMHTLSLVVVSGVYSSLQCGLLIAVASLVAEHGL